MSDPFFHNVSLLIQSDTTNGSTTFVDSSGSPLSVTPNGNTQHDTAQSKWGGSSILFDGANDDLQFPDAAPELDLGTGDFTVEGWVRINSSSGGSIFYSTGDVFGSNGCLFQINTSLGLQAFGNNVSFFSGSGDLTLNTWHHVAFVRSGSTLYGFVDGVLADSGTMTLDLDGSVSNFIGEREYNSTFGENFYGHLDDFRLTNGVARYTSDFSVPTAAFPAEGVDPYWDKVQLYVQPTGADASTTFTDDSDNGLTVTTVGDAQVDTGIAKYTAAALFDGTGDYLTLANNAAFEVGSEDFSFEFWMYAASAGSGTNRGVISKRSGTGTYDEFAVFIDSSNLLQFLTSNNGTSWTGVFKTTAITHDTWYHVAVGRTGSTPYIWMNGVSSINSTTGVVTGDLTNGSTGLALGALATDGFSPFRGSLSHMRLTVGKNRYTSAFTSPVAPFAAQGITPWTPAETTTELWLDASDTATITETSGNVTAWDDKSGNGNDATASNTPRSGDSTQNGLNVIDLDHNNSEYFTLTGLTGITGGVSAFIVTKVTNDPALDNTDPAENGIWQIHNGGGSFPANHYSYTDGAIYDSFGSTVRKSTGNPSQDLTAWHIYNVDSEASNWTSRHNGTQHYTTATNTFGIAGTTYLGASVWPANVTTYYHSGSFAEFIVIEGVVSASDRQKIEGYLAWKWGLEANLPSGHPYEFAPPPTEASGTPALTATDVESASEVDTPTLTINVDFVLTANDVESASEVGAPTLVNTYYELTANGVESASSVDVPTFALLTEFPPTITNQPDDTTIMSGDDVTFTVAATGIYGHSVTVQWYDASDDSAISGETGLTYTRISQTVDDDDGFQVYAIFTDSVNSLTTQTNTVTLTVLPVNVTDGVQYMPLRSFTPGATPTTSNLAEGELAINVADKKLFSRDDSDNIVTLGGLYDGSSLPTSDPAVAGALWNDNGTVKISNG